MFIDWRSGLSDDALFIVAAAEKSGEFRGVVLVGEFYWRTDGGAEFYCAFYFDCSDFFLSRDGVGQDE